MSVGVRISWNAANTVAQELAEWIRPSCHVVGVAGSLRRTTHGFVHDVDIVAAPHHRPAQRGEGGGDLGRVWTEQALVDIRGWPGWSSEFRPDPACTTRQVKGSSRTVRALHIELYLCHPNRFGWMYMLRTGPADFGRELVSRAPAYGFRFKDGRLHRIVDGIFAGAETLEPIDTPTEESVWHALELPVIHPAQRTAEAVRRVWPKQSDGVA